jgi:hypothetical protein
MWGMHYSEAAGKISGHIISDVYHAANYCKREAQLIMRFRVGGEDMVHPDVARSYFL